MAGLMYPGGSGKFKSSTVLLNSTELGDGSTHTKNISVEKDKTYLFILSPRCDRSNAASGSISTPSSVTLVNMTHTYLNNRGYVFAKICRFTANATVTMTGHVGDGWAEVYFYAARLDT